MKKKRRLSAELNWIKRLQTPFPPGLNDQIYQQGNISSVRSNINVFSLKPDIRRKRRSHCLRRNGLSRRQQRLNRSLDDLLRIANNNGRHELLHALSSIPVSRLKPILDDADRRSLRDSDWFKLKMIMAFSFNKLFPRIPQLPPKSQFIKIKFINQDLDLLNSSNIFRDHRVASKIPQYFENLDPPLICYQYKNIFRDHRVASKISQYFGNLDPPLICYQYKNPLEISFSTTTKSLLILMFGVLFNLFALVQTRHFCIHLQAMLSRGNLPVSLTRDYGDFLRKDPNTDFHPGLILLSAGVLSRKHSRLTVNDGVRRKASEWMPLTTRKMNCYVLLILG